MLQMLLKNQLKMQLQCFQSVVPNQLNLHLLQIKHNKQHSLRSVAKNYYFIKINKPTQNIDYQTNLICLQTLTQHSCNSIDLVLLLTFKFYFESSQTIIPHMKYVFIAFAIILVLSSSQTCDISQDLRVECGYTGINQQQCAVKGCCWRPTRFGQLKQQKNDVPWCYYSQGQNQCKKINYSWSGGMGFDKDIYGKMYALFQANIDIQGLGGIVAAPDFSTPGGSYYYDWMRDGALSMRIYMELNNFDLSIVEQKMKSYVNWVRNVQTKHDPQGYDVRINPKFQLPNGQVYIGPWCRPQTDGPGLRSATLQLFAHLLLKNGQQSYFSSKVLEPIKYDLDWIMNYWQSESCDLWQQVRSTDFFWGRATYVYALEQCENLFSKVGDNLFALKCSSTKNLIKRTLDGHWTGTFMKESSNREKDGAVVHAFSSFGTHQITDLKVAKTMKVLGFAFCSQYTLNQAMTKGGIPGVLIGRYPGDTYAGGNPWQLLSAAFAKAFYQGANVLIQANGFLKVQDQKAWFELLEIKEGTTISEQVKVMIQAGDAVLYRLYQHVKSDNGHIFEQMDRNSGIQKSAHDLTWSYANILSAMQEREKAAGGYSATFKVSLE